MFCNNKCNVKTIMCALMCAASCGLLFVYVIDSEAILLNNDMVDHRHTSSDVYHNQVKPQDCVQIGPQFRNHICLI